MGFGLLSGLGQGLTNVAQGMDENIKAERINEWRKAETKAQWEREDTNNAEREKTRKSERVEDAAYQKTIDDRRYQLALKASNTTSSKIDPVVELQIKTLNGDIKALAESGAEPSVIQAKIDERNKLIGLGGGNPNPAATTPQSGVDEQALYEKLKGNTIKPGQKSTDTKEQSSESRLLDGLINFGKTSRTVDIPGKIGGLLQGERDANGALTHEVEQAKSVIISALSVGDVPPKDQVQKAWPYLTPELQKRIQALYTKNQ